MAGSRINRATFTRLTDHLAELLQVQGLEQIIVSPKPHRVDGRIGRPGQGDKNDGDAGVYGADLHQNFQAGLVGKS